MGVKINFIPVPHKMQSRKGVEAFLDQEEALSYWIGLSFFPISNFQIMASQEAYSSIDKRPWKELFGIKLLTWKIPLKSPALLLNMVNLWRSDIRIELKVCGWHSVRFLLFLVLQLLLIRFTQRDFCCINESTMKYFWTKVGVENWISSYSMTVIGSACVVDSLTIYIGSSNCAH